MAAEQSEPISQSSWEDPQPERGVLIEPYRGPMVGPAPLVDEAEIPLLPELKDAPVAWELDNLPSAPAYQRGFVQPAWHERDSLAGVGLVLAGFGAALYIYFVASFRDPLDPFLGLPFLRHIMWYSVGSAVAGMFATMVWIAIHLEAGTTQGSRRNNIIILVVELATIIAGLLAITGICKVSKLLGQPS